MIFSRISFWRCYRCLFGHMFRSGLYKDEVNRICLNSMALSTMLHGSHVDVDAGLQKRSRWSFEGIITGFIFIFYKLSYRQMPLRTPLQGIEILSVLDHSCNSTGTLILIKQQKRSNIHLFYSVLRQPSSSALRPMLTSLYSRIV